MGDLELVPEAWENAFLSAYLSEYGTITKAAEVAGVTPAKVKALAKKSPLFKQKFEEAQEILKDVVRHELLRRALEPSERPIIQRGKVVGVIREWDNKHLQWVAERMMPQEFHLPSRVEFSGDADGAVKFKLELAPGQSDGEDSTE